MSHIIYILCRFHHFICSGLSKLMRLGVVIAKHWRRHGTNWRQNTKNLIGILQKWIGKFVLFVVLRLRLIFSSCIAALERLKALARMKVSVAIRLCMLWSTAKRSTMTAVAPLLTLTNFWRKTRRNRKLNCNSFLLQTKKTISKK